MSSTPTSSNSNQFEEESSLLHPLAGSNFKTLCSCLNNHNTFDSDKRLSRLIAIASVLGRFPFYKIEQFLNDKKIGSTKIKDPLIFIVGHWRSGTTHLHNLLSQDSQFGSISFLQTAIPWNLLSKIKIASWIIDKVLPETRGMDNVKLSLDSPQEEEMAIGNMGTLCYYYCYYFPQEFRYHFNRSILLEGVEKTDLKQLENNYNYLIKKLTLAHDGKPLMLKNPANTGRIKWLKNIFPNAKFIHIRRNPYKVFSSNVKHFDRIMPAFAWQKYDKLDFEKLTIENYALMMNRYLKDRSSIAKENLIEVSYESVDENPYKSVDEIYSYLNLPGKESALRNIKKYSDQIRSYKKNKSQLTENQVNKIEDNWEFALEEWNYGQPDDLEII